MGNILDYLDWRGDIEMKVSPFNEVDNLLLSEIVYTPFEEILHSPEEKLTLKEASDLFFSHHRREEFEKPKLRAQRAPLALLKAASSRRFFGTSLYGFISDLDPTTKVQFASITFLLPDHTLYIAFRGTDNSLVGWQEDLNTSYLDETPGQRKAVSYVDRISSHTLRKVRVGGHSKGGNLAVYGAAFASERAKRHLIEVWSNDGPGFRERVTKTPEYQSIVGKVHSIVPKHSIVGMIMDNAFPHEIILSSENGIMQHDGFSWEVLGTSFLRAGELARSSLLFMETLREWLDGISDEDRKEFIEILFKALSYGGEEKMTQAMANKIRLIKQAKDCLKGLPMDKQVLFGAILLKLVKSYASCLMEDFNWRGTDAPEGEDPSSEKNEGGKDCGDSPINSQ